MENLENKELEAVNTEINDSPSGGKSPDAKTDSAGQLTSISVGKSTAGVVSKLRLDGVVNFAETKSLHAFRSANSTNTGTMLELALHILQSARGGVANLVASLGVDQDAFSHGLKSRMFNVINTLSQFRYSDAYSRWILATLAKSDPASLIKPSDKSGLEQTITSNMGGDVLMSLIMVAASQNLIDLPKVSVNGAISFAELNSLQTDKKLHDLANQTQALLAKATTLIASSKELFSKYTDGSDILGGAFMPPVYLGDSFDDLLRTIKEYAPSATEAVVDAYENLTRLFEDVAKKVGTIENANSTQVAQQTAIFVLRADIMRALQVRFVNDNSSVSSKDKDALNSGILSLAIRQINTKAGESMKGLIDDLTSFAYSYRMVAEAVSKIGDLRYSDTGMKSLLAYYTATMSGIYDIRNEDEMIQLIESFKRNTAWNGSLASILHNLAVSHVSDEKLTGSEEYGRLLTIMEGVLSDNKFFSVKLTPHISELALGSSRTSRVPFGHVFTINEKRLNSTDVFEEGDDIYSSLPSMFDALTRVLVDPTTSPMFSQLYRLYTLKTVLSETVRLRIASNIRPVVMAPFKFSDDNIAKLMPFLSSVSYAMQASMGVYYQAIESVRIIAIRLVKSIFSDISTLSKNEDMSSVWTVLRGEDGVKYFDELVGLINEAEAVTLARLNASSVNLDKLRIHTSTDVVTFNADKKYVEDICRRYINKSSLRSSHGILFNVVERTLKREIADVTLFSTSDANELSDQIRNACIETIRDEYNPHVAVEKEMKSYQMAIDRLRDDMANMLKIRVEDHAIGRLLSMSFSLQSVLGYTKSASSATASMNNVLMYNLAKDILKLRKQRVFQINTNVSRMERTAYSLVKPSIFRLLAAFRYEWRHKIRSAYVPETIDFNFYDERHAVLRILETIGVDPNTTLSDNDAAFLSDVLGDGSIFTFKYVKGGTLYESIRLNSDEAQAASKSGLLVYSMLPIESIGDIFSDRVVLESSISHSHMLLINKLARDGEILDKLDSLDMMVNVTAIEADEVAAQFISADALAKRIFDNLVQPLISELWM